MSLLVVGSVTVLVLILLGYRLNRADGRIEQGGLLQFVTAPSGASVTVDGQTLGSTTPSKLTTNTGSHQVIMRRDNYRTWEKTVNLKAGTILWLNYARLIPVNPTTTTLADYSELSDVLASSTGAWTAIKTVAASPDIIFADTESDTVRYTTLTLPSDTYSTPSVQGSSRFEMMSWDKDEKRLLVRHTYDTDKVEWLRITRDNPSATINLSRLFGVDITDAKFHPINGNELYVISAGDIRKLDIGAETISRALATNVREINVHKTNAVSYVSNPDEATGIVSVGYVRENDKKAHTIQTFERDTPNIHISMAEYFGKNYVAVSHKNTVEISEVSLSDTTSGVSEVSSVKVLTTSQPTDWLSFSVNGRFVSAQSGNVLNVYDLETDSTYATQYSDLEPRRLEWLDDYTIWDDRSGTIRLYEFDGANQQNIANVAPGFDVRLNPSGKYLYSIGKTEKGFALQRTQLIL